MLASECTVFCETVWLAAVEIAAIPTTDCPAFTPKLAFAFPLVVERLRTVLPVMVFTPAEVKMPRICPVLLPPA